MAYVKKGPKPEPVFDPMDPAVIEQRRMEQDQAKAAAVSQAEQERIARIAAEDAEKIRQAEEARRKQDESIQNAADAAAALRMKTPLSEEEQGELAGLEIEANSGRPCAREQMIRLGELRVRSKVKE